MHSNCRRSAQGVKCHLKICVPPQNFCVNTLMSAPDVGVRSTDVSFAEKCLSQRLQCRSWLNLHANTQ